MASYQTGPDLWKRTDYKASDVDTVQFYDGFSFYVITWLEALGFCDVGEGGRFIEGGKRIALDGELPLNTFGGQIGAGRLALASASRTSRSFNCEARAALDRSLGDPRVAVCTSRREYT